MYDMDELEIQNKVLLDITSRELKEEKDRWHRKYNDAEIEIAKLSKENEDYKMAIQTLIWERDSAITDVNSLINYRRIPRGKKCFKCAFDKDPICSNKCLQDRAIWRGIREQNNPTT